MTVYAYKLSGKKFHRYDFMLSGQRYTKRGFSTRRAALDAEAARRQEVHRGLSDPYPSFWHLVGAFLADGPRRKSEDWCNQLELKLNKAFKHLGHLHPREIKRGHIEVALDKISAAGNGPRSINEYRKIIKAVFNFAVVREALETNPVAGIEKRPEPETQVDPIPRADLSKLILAADLRLRAMLVFLSQTGARFIEARRLTKTDLKLDAGEPFCLLRTKKRRGGHERVRPQPLTRLALNAIESTATLSATYVFPDGHGAQVSYRAELKRLHSLCVRLELPAYSFHQVRHWAGGVATAMGKNKKAVATFLGHTDTHATERYLHFIEPDKWEVARQLEAELSAEIGAPENSVTKGAANEG